MVQVMHFEINHIRVKNRVSRIESDVEDVRLVAAENPGDNSERTRLVLDDDRQPRSSAV